jgi:hypothetical protein
MITLKSLPRSALPWIQSHKSIIGSSSGAAFRQRNTRHGTATQVTTLTCSHLLIHCSPGCTRRQRLEEHTVRLGRKNHLGRKTRPTLHGGKELGYRRERYRARSPYHARRVSLRVLFRGIGVVFVYSDRRSFDQQTDCDIQAVHPFTNESIRPIDQCPGTKNCSSAARRPSLLHQ